MVYGLGFDWKNILIMISFEIGYILIVILSCVLKERKKFIYRH